MPHPALFGQREKNLRRREADVLISMTMSGFEGPDVGKGRWRKTWGRGDRTRGAGRGLAGSSRGIVLLSGTITAPSTRALHRREFRKSQSGASFTIELRPVSLSGHAPGKQGSLWRGGVGAQRFVDRGPVVHPWRSTPTFLRKLAFSRVGFARELRRRGRGGA